MPRSKTASRRGQARRNGTAPTRPGTALRARCRVRLDRSLVDLGGLAASLPDDVANRDDGYAVDLLLTDEEQRVTYGTGTDNAVTVVHRGGRGMIVWDHRTRSVARIDQEGIPRNTIAPGPKLKVNEVREGRNTVFLIGTSDPTLGDLRHEMTVSSRPEYAPFGPALMRVLHCGPGCHAASGLPWERIASAGLITAERTVRKGRRKPVSELVVESLELTRASAKDFEPPAGFRPLEDLLRQAAEAPPAPPSRPPGEPDPLDALAEVARQALEDGSGGRPKAKMKIREDLTPDCLGSTRFGSVAATLHQDFFTIAMNTVNLVAPFVGPTTIGGGTWTIPWLANLASINSANPNGPGSGIFCLLRQPRTVGSPPFPGPGGGGGLLDRLAFRSLYELDGAGLMRTQRDFIAGTLPATLASWSAGPPASTNLMAASGDLRTLSLIDQQSLVEAYEMAELGTLRVGALPATLGPFPFGSITSGGITTPPLFTLGVTGVAGTANFATLAGPFVTLATIGSSGNVVIGVSLPTIGVTGTITRATTPFANFLVGAGTIAFCFLAPLFCPLVVTLIVLFYFVLNNVTRVTARATGVSWMFDVAFDFDPGTERVEPFVSLVGRTGTITVTPFGPTPNIIGNAVDSLIAALGNLIDGWAAMLAAAGVPALQQLLRDNGLQLPVGGRQSNLKAVSGSATSAAGAVLELMADVRPVDEVATQPFTTQVATDEQIRNQLRVAHLTMRSGLNPQTPPPPGPGPAIAVGTFAGLGVSQNALNYYLYAQWIARRLEVNITDPPTIARFVGTAPGLFVRFPLRVHLWPAVPPRVELAPDEVSLGNAPLVVYFDDVRACFEGPNASGMDSTVLVSGLSELCCNFRTTGTIEIAWPWVFNLRLDQARASGHPLEPRTWELADPNNPGIMGPLGPADLARMVDLVAAFMIAPMTSQGITRPTAVRPWNRPLPAIQQDIFDVGVPTPALLVEQQVYLEMMTRRKALYLLPAIDFALFDLVDGSGAFNLNMLLLPAAMAPGPIPTTVSAMRCAQGAALRDWLFPITGPAAGP